jgi:hypothetical protein
MLLASVWTVQPKHDRQLRGIQDPVREIRPHPGVAVERDQKALLARLLREMNLDVDAPAEPYSHPPRLIGENKCHDLEEQLE